MRRWLRDRLYAAKRRMYPDDRPGRLARWLNRLDAAQYGAGLLSPRRAVTLEVTGRRTGRPISVPVVVATLGDDRYLVSMLGERANWVHNVRAAGGRAVLRRGRREAVLLTEVPAEQRPPVLRRYLRLAPGARPHMPITAGSSEAELRTAASAFPVFRVRPRTAVRGGPRGALRDHG
ncbi:nitroreductase family deazaflavin-dependent oxidoreductase [Catenuloplanes indicus]|uniref:Deazaflavin-dependent oxidoreductase (Nitroreductase family) n=1 Tax=Catenuloplanes indicus TaxID=137267 RepID=A0AAE4AUK0_9ACTN|nr:nitroreductase family deazaflavin-dependent oxidoreductase [Catenuloplanes indicus]MDQ0363840.1 deazaflavin-dependent oxidoreductase (nitroreductase family) [Catenuloplanes indicus]